MVSLDQPFEMSNSVNDTFSNSQNLEAIHDPDSVQRYCNLREERK